MPLAKTLGALLLVTGVTAYLVWSEWPSKPRPVARPAMADAPRVEKAPGRASEEAPEVRSLDSLRPASVVAAPAALDEPALMATLRELGPNDPERAIRLAREGNQRFPASSDAAERAWFLAKSLAGLGRFHEARDEARLMVRRFPGTPWAEDAERHLLVHPLDQPSREEQQEWENSEGPATP